MTLPKRPGYRPSDHHHPYPSSQSPREGAAEFSRVQNGLKVIEVAWIKTLTQQRLGFLINNFPDIATLTPEQKQNLSQTVNTLLNFFNPSTPKVSHDLFIDVACQSILENYLKLLNPVPAGSSSDALNKAPTAPEFGS